MVLHFNRTLSEALAKVNFNGRYHRFPGEKYGDAKWGVVDVLNKHFNENFDLYNWLKNEEDDVAHFLNEVGSNTLNYSQFKTPSHFHLWIGNNGFVIGVEQKGSGFDAQEVDEKRIKDNEGAAFNFFRNSKSKIFFDNARNARIVYMEFLKK